MTTHQPLLPAEREYLEKERATLIDRLRYVENRLNRPSSIVDHHLRRVMLRAMNHMGDENENQTK